MNLIQMGFEALSNFGFKNNKNNFFFRISYRKVKTCGKKWMLQLKLQLEAFQFNLSNIIAIQFTRKTSISATTFLLLFFSFQFTENQWLNRENSPANF